MACCILVLWSQIFFSTFVQPITNKHGTLRINTKVHTHKLCTHNVSSLYKALILLCDIVTCFWQPCNTNESILYQLRSRKLILKSLINGTWRSIHTWNAINYVLILFSSSINDLFCNIQNKKQSHKDNNFELIVYCPPDLFIW